jgi:predicted dehydrogenase
MAAKKARWGLISTARINVRLIPVMQQSARSELLAVASRDTARAEKYARDWQIPKTYRCPAQSWRTWCEAWARV